MYKIIKIADDIVFVGNGKEGNFTEIPLTSFGFDPKVGDYVEFYKNGEEYIVSKIDPIAQFTGNGGVKGQSHKSKVTAAVLAFFGAFGFYEFYIGNVGKGLLRILITAIGVIPFLTPVIIFFNIIWNLINTISILLSKPGSKWHQDAHGLELQD